MHLSADFGQRDNSSRKICPNCLDSAPAKLPYPELTLIPNT